ncbi:MAG: putative rane protein [Anaerocolumna sp.]|jgi:glycopeptide antibiotics resistance protein|nr:putative rane protein [Anaerocolumna sp.]
MRRSSNHITTLIIILSILSVTVQFGTYYFLGATIYTIAIAVLVSLVISHVFLEQSLNYEPCFSYSLLNVFISVVITLLSFYGNGESFITFNTFLYLFVLINWFIPTIYSIIRCLFDHGPKYNRFTNFYRNNSIVFIIFYIVILIYIFFLDKSSNQFNNVDLKSLNIIPFLSFATFIEGYLDGVISMNVILNYLTKGILLFMPYGFYIILLLKNTTRIVRFLSLLFLPLIIEALQWLTNRGRIDIDDILLGLLGGFIGALCYHLLNSIFRIVKDEDFLTERSIYSFYRNSLHF